MTLEFNTINNIEYIYKDGEWYWFKQGTSILHKGGPGSGPQKNGSKSDEEQPSTQSQKVKDFLDYVKADMGTPGGAQMVDARSMFKGKELEDVIQAIKDIHSNAAIPPINWSKNKSWHNVPY